MGNEAVTSIETFKGKGIYSAVTLDNEFLVVDDVVASPFAMAHGIVNAYYNPPRLVQELPVALEDAGSGVGELAARGRRDLRHERGHGLGEVKQKAKGALSLH